MSEEIKYKLTDVVGPPEKGPDEPALRKARKLTRTEQRAIDAKGRLSSPWASGVAVLLALVWTIPTFGLFLTSFRPEPDIRKTGWWTFFSNPSLTLDNYEETLFGSSTGLATFFLWRKDSTAWFTAHKAPRV